MVPVRRTRSPRRHPTESRDPELLAKSLPPTPPPTPPSSTTVLVGAERTSFKVNRERLCAVAGFFRDRVGDASQPRLWLPGESAAMFALFVEWLHAPWSFRRFLDRATGVARGAGQQASRDMHWPLVCLHLFASRLHLHELQDRAMDGIQDLYLGCDWHVSPSLVAYLYTKCDLLPAVRIRRWAVAMVAFSSGARLDRPAKARPQDAATSDPGRFRALLEALPEFAADYGVHVRRMKKAGLDVRLKNPRLRIAANRLQNDQRLFGFRECSFHSHRAAVGEARCPRADDAARGRHLKAAALSGMTAASSADPDLVPRPRPLSPADGSDSEGEPAEEPKPDRGR